MSYEWKYINCLHKDELEVAGEHASLLGTYGAYTKVQLFDDAHGTIIPRIRIPQEMMLRKLFSPYQAGPSTHSPIYVATHIKSAASKVSKLDNVVRVELRSSPRMERARGHS